MAVELFETAWEDEPGAPQEAGWGQVLLALTLLLAVAGMVVAISAVSDYLVR